MLNIYQLVTATSIIHIWGVSSTNRVHLNSLVCSYHKCICVVLLLPIQYIWAVLIAATVCRLGCYHQYIYTNTIWTGDHTNANNPFSVTISSLRVQSWSCSCWHGPTGPTVHLTQSCLQIWRVSPGGADWHTVYSQQWVSQPAFDILSSPSGTFSYLTISRSHQVWPINGHYVFLPAQSDWIFQASVTSWYNGYHCRTLYSQCRPYCDQVSQVLLGPTGSVLSETKREDIFILSSILLFLGSVCIMSCKFYFYLLC